MDKRKSVPRQATTWQEPVSSTQDFDERIHEMSHMHDQSATSRADRPARRLRRSTSPVLTTLEDRRLMTAGVATTTAATTAAAIDPTATTSAAPLVAPARMSTMIAPAGDSSSFYDPTQTDDWIYSGSDAQFGPTGNIVLYGGGSAWPTTWSGPSATDVSPEQAKLDAAFAKQSADMQAIQDKSQVTPALLASLRAARSTVADQAGAPDATLLKTFQADAQTVQTSGTFTDAQKQQLQSEYTAVLKSAGVSDAAITALFAAQDAVKTAGGVTAADVATLAADQQAVQTLMDAMPKDAVTYSAASDAFRSNAAGSPMTTMMMTPPGAAAMSTTATAATTAPGGTGAVATTAVPSTAVTTDVSLASTTTVAPTTTATTTSANIDPAQLAAARAAAVGAIPVGVRVQRAGNSYLSTTTTVGLPNYHSTSSVTPLAGAVKRLSARALNNAQSTTTSSGARRGIGVRTLNSGTATATAVPAIRQRLAFAGSMRQARTS